MDKVRPGGLVAFITSTGTQVTSDIVILQKRVDPKKPYEHAQDWAGADKFDGRLKANEYFIKHLDNTLEKISNLQREGVFATQGDKVYREQDGKLVEMTGKNAQAIKNYLGLQKTCLQCAGASI